VSDWWETNCSAPAPYHAWTIVMSYYVLCQDSQNFFKELQCKSTESCPSSRRRPRCRHRITVRRMSSSAVDLSSLPHLQRLRRQQQRDPTEKSLRSFWSSSASWYWFRTPVFVLCVCELAIDHFSICYISVFSVKNCFEFYFSIF
jgi:hypothetical protein